MAAIVNAIGNSYANSGHQCDYWGGNGLAGEQPTAILITWDDWGGFYDHVSPLRPDGPGIGYQNDILHSGWYVYGFRVPLLVVSRYTKQTTDVPGYTGYVSGPRDSHTCNGTTNYCHDFGSILNFIEFTFGTNGQYKGSIGDTHSDYADALAPDTPPTCLSCSYSLSDFFNFSQPHDFVTITGWKYPRSCFKLPKTAACFGTGSSAADPDNDALEE